MENNENEGILMPEIIIYKTLISVFDIIKKDFVESSDVTKTILFDYFGKDGNGDVMKFEQFDYFKQAVATFVNKKVNVNIGYSLETAEMGCVHILLPNETGRPMGIGADENYQPYLKEYEPNGSGSYRARYNEMFDSTYNLMITSTNTFEVILIYNLIKGAFISLNAHLELAGLRLPKLAGQDIQLQSDLVPSHIFHRSLMLSFVYELIVPDFFSRKIISNFATTGIISSNTNNDS